MALNQDTNPTIKPKLVFGGTIPTQGYTPNQHGNDRPIKKNAVNAEKFNEYERILYLLSNYLGNVQSDFSNQTIGSMLRATNERIDDMVAVTGEGKPAGAFHISMLDGNVLRDPLDTKGSNPTEARANGFELILAAASLQATIKRGVGVVGDTKSNMTFVETDADKTLTIEAVEYLMMGQDGSGNEINPIDTSHSTWQNGELRTMGAETEFYLEHEFTKSSFFTGSNNSTVVAIEEVTDTVYSDTGIGGGGADFTIDKTTGKISGYVGWSGRSFRFYYTYYGYSRDWIYLVNAPTDSDKIIIRKGQTYGSLSEAAASSLYYNSDTSTYIALPNNTSTETILYEITTYPWNTLIDDFSQNHYLDMNTNIVDRRIGVTGTIEKWKSISNGVINYPTLEYMIHASYNATLIDYQLYRDGTNRIRVTNGDIIDSHEKIFSTNKKLEVEFDAITDDTNDVTLTLSMYNTGSATTIASETFTINSSNNHFKWTANGSNDSDVYESVLRITSDVGAAKYVYIDNLTLTADAGVKKEDVDGTNKLSVLPHLILVDGYTIITEPETFSISNTDVYATIVSDNQGAVDIRYGDTNHPPLADNGEAILQNMYIDSSYNVFSVPFLATRPTVMFVHDMAEFMVGLAMARDGRASELIVVGDNDFTAISSLTIPSGANIRFVGEAEQSEIKIVGTWNMSTYGNVNYSNAIFNLTTGASSINIGNGSADSYNIDTSLYIKSDVAMDGPVVNIERSYEGRIRVASNDLLMAAASTIIKMEGGRNCLDVQLSNLTAGGNAITNTVDLSDCEGSIVTSNIECQVDGTTITNAIYGNASSINNTVMVNISPDSILTNRTGGISLQYGYHNTFIINSFVEADGIDITNKRLDGALSHFVRAIPNDTGTGGTVYLGDDNPDGDVDVVVSGDLTVLGTEYKSYAIDNQIADDKITLNAFVSGVSENGNASLVNQRYDPSLNDVSSYLKWIEDEQTWHAGYPISGEQIPTLSGETDAYAFLSKDVVAQRDPTENDDETLGYNTYSRWINADDFNRMYFCKEPSSGNAVWEEAGGGSVRAITIDSTDGDISTPYDMSLMSYNTINCDSSIDDVGILTPNPSVWVGRVLEIKNISSGMVALTTPNGISIEDDDYSSGETFDITGEGDAIRLTSIKNKGSDDYNWWLY